MADIVGQQGAAVTIIGETATASHEKAEAGLAEVKQAAAYQPTCTIS